MSRSLRHDDEPPLPAPVVRTPLPQDVQPKAETPSRSTPVVAVIALLFVGLFSWLLWPRSTPPPSQPTPQPVAIVVPSVPTATHERPTSVPTPEPTPCPSIEAYEDIIRAHQGNGRWQEAAATAESALAVPTLCDTSRKVLTHLAVTSRLKAIMLEPFKPLDRAGHQQLIDSYLALRKRAHDAAIPIDTPLQVASEAFGSSQFHLARVAFEEALEDGDFDPEIDRDITKQYVSTVYGLGAWYTTAPWDTPLYQEGLSWLSASHRLAEKYKTGQGEAAMLLSQLVSPDRAKWPPPAEMPLLP